MNPIGWRTLFWCVYLYHIQSLSEISTSSTRPVWSSHPYSTFPHAAVRCSVSLLCSRYRWWMMVAQQVKECSHGQRVVGCILSRLTLCGMQFACAQSGSQLSKSTRNTADIESCTGQTWKQNKWGCLKKIENMVLQIYRFISIISYLHILYYPNISHLKLPFGGHPIFRHTRIAKIHKVVGVFYQRSRVDCCEVLSRPTVSQQCCKPSIEICEQLFTQRIRTQVLDRSFASEL